MATRKPLDPGCVGGIFCPVPDHVTTRVTSSGRGAISHVPLTRGQHKTLMERNRAQSAQVQEVTEDHVCDTTCRRCGCCDHSTHECMGCIRLGCTCPAIPVAKVEVRS